MILLLQQLQYKHKQEGVSTVKYCMFSQSKLGFIGAGKMVSAMVSSLLRSGSFKPENLVCCSANDGTSERLSKKTGILHAISIPELLVSEPDVLILGCKPQQLTEVSSVLYDKKVESIILSIMAGITLGRLSDSFPNAQNVIRSMPNTPGQIGEGITGFVFLNSPNQSEHRLVTNILSSMGESFELKSEEDIDRITAISGSGPAYLFEFTCALECAAKEIGLPEKLANKFALQTVSGASKLLTNSGLHPEELRDQVTSPKGTTQAALESLEKNNLRKIVQDAVEAAKARSIELSNA